VLRLIPRGGPGGHEPARTTDTRRIPPYRWRLVGLLAVSQTVGYGVMFYSFSVFLTPTAVALRTSTTTVTGAMTASLLAGAIKALAPLATVLLWHTAGLAVALDTAAACCLLGAFGLVLSEQLRPALGSTEQVAYAR
jgi:hypothetical protein